LRERHENLVDDLFDRFDVVFDTVGAPSLHQCGIMLKHGGMSLHIVPNFAKWIGALFSRRHHLVFGNPTPQSMAGVPKLPSEAYSFRRSDVSCPSPRLLHQLPNLR
jgi:NADPH:quinone reductase-like Zn-dependent oxidoreductase